MCSAVHAACTMPGMVLCMDLKRPDSGPMGALPDNNDNAQCHGQTVLGQVVAAPSHTLMCTPGLHGTLGGTVPTHELGGTAGVAPCIAWSCIASKHKPTPVVPSPSGWPTTHHLCTYADVYTRLLAVCHRCPQDLNGRALYHAGQPAACHAV